MSKLQRTIGLVVVVWAVCGAQAQNFTLTGAGHIDVVGRYSAGRLYDYSSANLPPPGHVFRLETWNSSSVNLFGGDVSMLYAYNSSSVDISEGSVGRILWARDSSTVGISGGSVGTLRAQDTSRVTFSGGDVWKVVASNNSMVDVSGGRVENLYVDNLRFGVRQPWRVTISGGGTVETLFPGIVLEGNEHLSHAANFTLKDLSAFGVIGGGTVGTIADARITAHEDSRVDISGGSVDRLSAYDSSTVAVIGGSLESLYAHDSSSSSVDISGGSVSLFYTSGTSTVNISDGSLDRLYAHGSSSVDIYGGHVDVLAARGSSTVMLYGFDFELGDGLSWDLDGQTLLGTGLLSGKWFGETELWTMDIYENWSTATIMAIPEPATLVLLALGGLGLLRRKWA